MSDLEPHRGGPPVFLSEEERKIAAVAKILEPISSAIRDTEIHRQDTEADVEKAEIAGRREAQQLMHQRTIEKQRHDGTRETAMMHHQHSITWGTSWACSPEFSLPP